jgi:hypothetical protein
MSEIYGGSLPTKRNTFLIVTDLAARERVRVLFFQIRVHLLDIPRFSHPLCTFVSFVVETFHFNDETRKALKRLRIRKVLIRLFERRKISRAETSSKCAENPTVALSIPPLLHYNQMLSAEL